MGEQEWIELTRQVVTHHLAIVGQCPLRSEIEKQRNSLALVAWDTGEYVRGALGLLAAKNHSAAYGLTRLIVERAETLVAVHHDTRFAARFWDASASFETLAARDRMPTDARGVLRRFVAERIGNEPSMGFLANQIEMISTGSLAVHASALIPAMTRGANEDEGNALTVAMTIGTACVFALFALVVVAEQRAPEYDYQPARELIRRIGDLVRGDADGRPSTWTCVDGPVWIKCASSAEVLAIWWRRAGQGSPEATAKGLRP